VSITLRLERPEDYRAVENLTREAFWKFMSPTCDEHYLVHLLRAVPAFLPELDFVAEMDGELVGHVMYSRAKVVDDGGKETEVLTFGPLSVLPTYWHCGVGSALMRHSIRGAKQMGYRAIVFYGHPDYYPRFGFRNAKAFGITTPNGKNFDALMAMPLYDGALDGVSGAFHEDPVFAMKSEKAEVFNRAFPHKQPASMIPIDVLTDKLEPAARKAFTERNITALAWLNRVSGREMLEWDGIDAQAMAIINKTLREHGYAEKLLPSSAVLQLAEMGVRIPVVTPIRVKDGISVYRAESEGDRYVLKVFDRPQDRREIENYQLLASLGVPVLPMPKHTSNALLLPDVESDIRFRLGCEDDLVDTRAAAALARWYKTLHEKGRVYVSTHGSALYDETDVITLPNMDMVAERTGTRANALWNTLRERFVDVRRLIDSLPRTLTYNDFYWTNLVVSRDYTSAMMLDFNLLGKGYAFADIRNVTSSLNADASEAFLSEYGTNGIGEDERLADAVLSPLTTLFFACEREVFPRWANNSLEELTSGALLESLLWWLDP
jgi:predicted N-acetyltransferase YhbS